MNQIRVGLCLILVSLSLTSQATIFHTIAVAPNCPNISIYNFAMNSNRGVMTPGHVRVSLPSQSGNLLVVVVGLNQWKHPVDMVTDIIGTQFTQRVIAFEPGNLTGDNEPDALLEIYAGFVPQNNSNDVITVHSRSGQFDVLVGQYSGVLGIGGISSVGGKSNKATFTMAMMKSNSYLVGGLERYSGASLIPGITTTVGKQLGAISTRGSNNNAGTNFMDNRCGSSLTLTTSLAGSNAWALGAIELLSK
ncbi:MAG: hypothetical protein OK457_10805 [Thaumarchaeota archaeon]|nr:hypothetical protein [Nitrososphaerota archaeon]